MGVCASVPEAPDSAAMRHRAGLASKAKRFFLASPAKEKALNGEIPVAGFDCKSPEFVLSKEEIFLDTRAWLDSDCEDDFFSVNGEFTPSGGSTPIHPLSSPLTPRLDNQILLNTTPDSKSEPSPTGRKKLSQLLHETLKSQQIKSPDAAAEEKAATADRPPNSLNSTPHRSGASSGGSAETPTPTDDLKIRKERGWRSGHCCLPSLKNFGFDERSQKMSAGPCAAV